MYKILLVKIGALGDVLRTTCILPGLREKYFDAHIVWLTSIDASQLLIHNPLVDELLYRESFKNTKLPSSLVFDLVINLDDDPWACEFSSSVVCAKFIGAYSHGGNLNYTADSAPWFDMSLISAFGKTCADSLKKSNQRTYPSLLFDILAIPSGTPSLVIPSKIRDQARSFSEFYLPDCKPVIGLNTGAGSRWRFKQLSEGKTAELANQLHEKLDTTLLLYGGPSEKNRNRNIQQLADCMIINTGNDNSLLEFAAKIELSNVLITSDSLALHIASCLCIPVIAFFGPTSSAEIELSSAGEKIVPRMNCTCCYLSDCDIRPTCMDHIQIDEIINAVKKLITV